MDKLPENCISKVITLTSPKDACRLSVVATSFNRAAESDQVWEKFLPTDYKGIIYRATNAPDVETTQTMKQLYFWLSQHFLILDQGTKCFSLEKGSGKICYMIAARGLNITPEPGNTRRWNWKLKPYPDSRFGEVGAVQLGVRRLEIRGKLNINILSGNTTYASYLVYRQKGGFCYENKPIEFSVGVSRGGETKLRTVNLNYTEQSYMPTSKKMRVDELHESVPRTSLVDVDADYNINNNNDNEVWDEEMKPKERGDGWWEIKLGEYYNGNDDGKDEELNSELEMFLMEGDACRRWKGLIVQGIEIRPKLD